MKVVIFIGHHKTGSASLQEFLSQNALGLLRAGILYPAVEAEGMSLMLERAMRGQDRTETLPFNFREAHNALAFRMLADVTGSAVPSYHPNLPDTDQMFRMIEQQIMVLEPRAVVLASEVMGNFSKVSPDLIRRLVSFFEGADIRIIANLRRVDDHIASWHGQRLRFGQKINRLSRVGMSPYRKGIHFDYRVLLDGWQTGASGAKLVLRAYGDVLAAGGSVTDMMGQSGLEFPRNLLDARRANRSLHRGLYEIARHGNHRLNTESAAELFKFLLRMAPRLDLPNTEDVELFTKPMRDNMARAFEPVHAYLGQIARRTPFFPDIDEIRVSRPHDGQEIAREALLQLRAQRGGIRQQVLREFVDELEL